VSDPIPVMLAQVDAERIRESLFYLSRSPLPYRKLNYTLPGHVRNTLYEADRYIRAQLNSWGYWVATEACPVQALRRDMTKPLSQQYAAPLPDDPWYTAYNLYAERRGALRPEEIVLVLSHKDSQSWIDSPGAYDNAVGTAGNLEIARVLQGFAPARTVRFLWCNEEHKPWTSVAAAAAARARGDNLVAVFNLDGLGGKPEEDIKAGRKTNVARYSTDEGKWLADLFEEVNETYGIGLSQSSRRAARINDDEGSFINAGFRSAVMVIGSEPYSDPNYHAESDIPESVDLDNVVMAVKASLAAILRVAEVA
jgi:hypothetical protein